MLRLFGILTIGNLLFGRRHHHRALRRGLLFGALLGYLSNRDFDMNRVRREAHETARKARSAAREAARAFREEIRSARKAEYDRWDAEDRDTTYTEQKADAVQEIRALPTSGTHEAKEIEELVEDMARNSGTAAAAANIPTIDFPEEGGKYDVSRKYGYV